MSAIREQKKNMLATFKTHLAQDNLEGIRTLLQNGFDPHSYGTGRRNPFGLALKFKNTEVFKLFKDYGFVLGRCHSGLARDVLETKNIDFIKFLMKDGFVLTSDVVHDAFHYSVYDRSYVKELILLSGINNICIYLGQTYLHKAVYSERRWVVKFLLENGIDTSVIDWEGFTALELAKLRSQHNTRIKKIYSILCKHLKIYDQEADQEAGQETDQEAGQEAGQQSDSE